MLVHTVIPGNYKPYSFQPFRATKLFNRHIHTVAIRMVDLNQLVVLQLCMLSVLGVALHVKYLIRARYKRILPSGSSGLAVSTWPVHVVPEVHAIAVSNGRVGPSSNP